jgi:hypothetical protein
MNGKNSQGDILVQSPILKWLDNFWYHYKWHTVAVLFITFVLVVCITQCARKEKHDVVVMYAGPYLYSGEEMLTVKEELNKAVPGDFNGDGKKNAGLVTYQVMTDEQLLAYKEQAGSVDTSYFTAQTSNCNNYLLTGECGILLIDRSLFEQLRDAERLRNLSEVFPALPSSAIDEYGIDFSATSLSENSEQLSKLPKDTVLCLLRPYVVGDISKSEIYSQIVNTFVQMAKG